jgi:hypothetical protein
MVFLTTQSENHGKEIALCLNTCRWTGFFGILRLADPLVMKSFTPTQS